MNVTATESARTLIEQARGFYVDSPELCAQLDECAARLDEPLRVALAGSLKAGKSTLLNSLVGQDIAPTDATECTRVVTWYRNGTTPKVSATDSSGTEFHIPVARNSGRLTFDLGVRTSEIVDRIDVEWPSSALARMTIIDTPGTSSLSTDVSARTWKALVPDDGVPGADAVVYLLRALNATDLQFLTRVAEHVGGESGPLGVIGVLSRADEVGAGRMDAMASADDVAGRFAEELGRSGLCQSVVPVAGLLALAARTLRQSEFAAFAALAEVPAADLSSAMLSADRFVREDSSLPVDAAMRAQLVERFGLFGIRLAVTSVKLGVGDSPTLAAELLRRSGLDELRRVIDVQFGQRADQLKSHTALVTLSRLLERNPRENTAPIAASAARLLADVHGFRELRLLGRLGSVHTDLLPDDLAALQRLIGGHGIRTHERLGATEGESLDAQRAQAADAAQRWRTLSSHPLFDQFTARACQVAARSAEGVLAEIVAE
ncbi:Isoniazid-inducible protein iniC [Rhodococcus sp. AD45-ID]|uniref:dynamin family protein n=1 Tax=unclassified Rhodococcus (in: high G+C Gram-positive bacteria) TaxID=192944 RepID=UPI0005D4091C|nr:MULTISPECIES: dynamin family protein [unclassified Rhodococcus (in: high G+C Gram-positive bacteria)]KJF23434.1 putative GTPase [Rhodococcus sp. AD45]PSR41878.1 Isoniazid-inducible protein iniC [Rhodococcus sp. AD45-ID]